VNITLVLLSLKEGDNAYRLGKVHKKFHQQNMQLVAMAAILLPLG